MWCVFSYVCVVCLEFFIICAHVLPHFIHFVYRQSSLTLSHSLFIYIDIIWWFRAAQSIENRWLPQRHPQRHPQRESVVGPKSASAVASKKETARRSSPSDTSPWHPRREDFLFGDIFGDVFGDGNVFGGVFGESSGVSLGTSLGRWFSAWLVLCPSVSRLGMLHFLMLWRCPPFSLEMPLGTPCLFGDAYGDAFGDLFGASLGSLWGKDFSSRKPLTETSHLFGAKSFFLWGTSLGMPFFSLGMPLGTPLRQQSILAGAAVQPSLCPSPTESPQSPSRHGDSNLFVTCMQRQVQVLSHCECYLCSFGR